MLTNSFNKLTKLPHWQGVGSERMKKSDIAEDVARQGGVAPATAADQVDKAVNSIVRALRNGWPARLPGLGTITPGKPRTFCQEPHDR